MIGLENDSNIDYTVQKGDLISLLIIEKSLTPDIHIINDLPTTHAQGPVIIDDKIPTLNQDNEQYTDIQHLEDIMKSINISIIPYMTLKYQKPRKISWLMQFIPI